HARPRRPPPTLGDDADERVQFPDSQIFPTPCFARRRPPAPRALQLPARPRLGADPPYPPRRYTAPCPRPTPSAAGRDVSPPRPADAASDDAAPHIPAVTARPPRPQASCPSNPSTVQLHRTPPGRPSDAPCRTRARSTRQASRCRASELPPMRLAATRS